MSNIEDRVMGSVAAIYVARKLMSMRALSLYALALSFIAAATLVSVPNVLANFAVVLANGGDALAFILVAVSKTKLLVQLALAVAALGLFGFVVDSVRQFSGNRTSLA